MKNIIIMTVLIAFNLSGQTVKIDLKKIDKKWIVSAANKYITEEPATITSFTSPRSAGGIHDFFSEGDYWWPDSSRPNGPYIQKDGLTNPDNFVDHRKAMIRFFIHTAALTSAFKITGHKKYALKAIDHLKAWFINEKTKMNPSLLYAQAIKGKFTGRGIGIIDTIHLIEIAQSIIVLEQKGMLKGDDLAAIKKWFNDYIEWLMNHKYGIDEMEAKNNHGTCWVMQVSEFAKLTGNVKVLDFCRNRYKEVLLPTQLGTDGSFPLELKRTKPYNYSLFNLDAMAAVCLILSDKNNDLWNYTLKDGRNIHKAIEFMYPFIKDKTKWPYPKDVMYFEYYPVRQPSLLFGAIAFNETKYISLWKTLDPQPANEEVIRNFPIRFPVLWYN